MIKKKIEEKKYEENYSPDKDFRISSEIEKDEITEKKEKLTDSEIKNIKEIIEKKNLGENLLPQVQNHAQEVGLLNDDQKIKKLLEIADKKGVIYAIGVARKMNSSFILDTFHDALAENGYYKIFLNKK